MEEKQDSLDYWLDEVQEKELYKFMYREFLLTQIPLKVQEDEGMFAQVLSYGTEVSLLVRNFSHPETQCSRVIREARRKVWEWRKDLCDRLYSVDDYEADLAECALCVAWGILYLERGGVPHVVEFLNQMLRIWKEQWPRYQYPFGGTVDGKTKLDIMHDLVKKREEEVRKKKDTQKKEAAQEGNESGCSQTMTELQTRIEVLEEQVKHYRNMEKGTALGLNQEQSSLFVKSMANTFGFTYTNMKTDLAPIAHGLFGWGQSKLAKCMSTPCDKEERDKLAELFKDVCPRLYSTIMKWGE